MRISPKRETCDMPEYHNLFKFKNQQVLELRFHKKFCESAPDDQV
jgi:hypothetical protein